MSLRRQQVPEHSFSCLSILAKANMLKQLKLCFRPALPAQERRKGHFAKVAGRLKRVSDGLRAMRTITLGTNRTYGGLYLHSMHAVKRRNRTHEIHNLHKTHRPNRTGAVV